MPRLVGIDIPDEKRVEIALTYIYGIGRNNVEQILREANVDADKRAKDLTSTEIANLQRVLERHPLEGNLRKQVRDNIERLKRVSTYRGMRHAQGLPARGQRTRTNARTKRGKRQTVGAMKKEDLAKMEAQKRA